jgi:glycosyltransferase involved in cell wall biosynthesis
MRIGLDVRYISHGLTGGVRTYVYHLARELPRCAPDHEFFFYADDKAPFELAGLPANVVLRVLPWRGMLSSVRNDILLGRWMERDGVDLAHCPGNYGPKTSVPLVVTLHDALNVFSMSQHLRGFGRRPRQVAMMLYLGRMTRATLRRAWRVITVSEHARRDIAARTGYPLERIVAIHEAAGEAFRVIQDRDALEQVRRRFELGSRIILADGIKNPAAVMDAYGRLPAHLRRTTQIVFFSREPTPRPAVVAALQTPGVRFIPRPPTTDLVALMNLATVFAFPSWYEGFGLPLVEAMQCGTPIVASSRGSIPEVVGEAGLIFDLEDPRQFADQLIRILEDESMRRELRAQALERATRFTWRRTARQTIGVYEDVASTLQRTA